VTNLLSEGVINPYVLLFFRILIAALLMAAGVSKLTNLHAFVQVVRDFRLLPENMAGAVGLMIPIVEVVLFLLLILNLHQPWSVISAASLFMLFGLAVAVNILRGRSNIPCGCFGRTRNQRLTWSLVLRNVVLASLTFSVAVAPTTSDNTSQPTMIDAAALILVAMTVLAAWRLVGLIRKNWHPLKLAETSSQSRASK
jgi:uncharacterized membrane protein YphA (DoxX/SURF4 family)